MMTNRVPVVSGFSRTLAILSLLVAAPVAAQTTPATPTTPPAAPAGRGAPAPAQSSNATAPANLPTGVALPPDYLIGPDDQLAIIFWKDKDMSVEALNVRPDGKITLPLINELRVEGLTTEQARLNITKAATQFMEDPSVSVIVRQINSRKVYITGQVAKPGAYPLTGPMTVVQLITLAGGVAEYAKKENIQVLRTEKGVQKAIRVNYKDLLNGKNLKQNNLELMSGDQVLVP